MPESYQVAVIGAGPGGYVAAIRAAQLGLKTLCVEKRATLGGTCLNVGCIPSKALLQSSEHYEQAQSHFESHGIKTGKVSLDLKTMMGRKSKVVDTLTKGIEHLFKKNKVNWMTGSARVTSPGHISVDGQEIKADNIILATGSEPTPLPFLPFDEKKIISSTGALSLEKVPKQLLVVGGGVIGLELGSVWRRLGAEVAVIEFMDHILPGMDSAISKEMLKLLKRQGMTFNLSHKVKEGKVVRGQVHLTTEDTKGVEHEFKGDAALISIGRRPHTTELGLEELGVEMERGRVVVDRQFRSNIEGLYAIGDLVDGPMLAHKAEEEGVACAEIVAGKHGHVDYLTIPGIVYTHPEVGSVGLTEEECKQEEIPYVKSQVPLKANPRARCIGDDAGFVKILAHKETDRVLGIHIVGPGASELIAEAVTVMAFQGSAEDIIRVCHGHPTLSETIKEAALGIHSRTIHI